MAIGLDARGGVRAEAGVVPVQVTVIFDGTALMTRLLRSRTEVFTIGSGVDVDLPCSVLGVEGERHTLVRSDGERFQLCLLPSINAQIVDRAKPSTLSRPPPSPWAQTVVHGRGDRPIALDLGCYVTVQLAPVTLHIQAVEPPPRVATRLWSRPDRRFQLAAGLSLFVHLAVLLVVAAVPPSAKALSLDLFDDAQRFIPVRMPGTVMPAGNAMWSAERGAETGEIRSRALPADEPSGKAGNQRASRGRRRMAIAGQGELAAGRDARELAREAGILGVMNRDRGSSWSSVVAEQQHAIGPDAMDVLGNLDASNVGEAPGTGGLDPVGDGRGSSARAPHWVAAGPLAKVGQGPGRSGGGGWTRGIPDDLGTRRSRPPTASEGKVVVRGSLDRALVRRVIRQHLSQIAYCYTRELQADPSLEGRVVVEFSIAGNGQVATAKVSSSTLESHGEVERCIVSRVRSWIFPAPDQGVVIVSYPFLLHRAGR